MSTYKILLGGYRESILVTSFEPSTAKFKTLSETKTPNCPSWIETSLAKGSNVFHCVSESEKTPGLAFSFVLEGDEVKVTEQKETKGIPAHVHVMKDGSGIVPSNYVAGTAMFFPTSSSNHSLIPDSPFEPLKFPFTYEGKTPPNTDRQDSPHPHEVIEGDDGTLYVPDLGGDKVWIVKREGEVGLKIQGHLEAPAGSGPRHASLSADGKHLYLLTEMGNTVVGWSLADSSKPIFEVTMLPPTIPKPHAAYMQAAELAHSPHYPRSLFASNRYELQFFQKDKSLPSIPDYPPTGDAIALLLLAEDGASVVDTKFIRTGCDGIRALSISPDGKYAAVAGQDNATVEIYQITGEHGEEWKLAAKEEGIDSITTAAWV